MSAPGDIDPGPHERVWFRNVTSGERAYKVVRGGIDKIRLNRPNEEIIRNLDLNDWTPELERRPYTVAQIAQVCHAADKVLCLFLGQYLKAKVEWLNMTPEQRKLWYTKGPSHPTRHKLWRAIMAAFEEDIG